MTPIPAVDTSQVLTGGIYYRRDSAGPHLRFGLRRQSIPEHVTWHTNGGLAGGCDSMSSAICQESRPEDYAPHHAIGAVVN